LRARGAGPRHPAARSRHRGAARHDRPDPGRVCRRGRPLRKLAAAEGELMRLDPLTIEVLRNYLQGAVEEMAYFTCGLLNPSGEFFAYPVELGVASFGGINYAATLEAVGPLEPGDVII